MEQEKKPGSPYGGFVGALSITGAIIGTIICVTSVFGEWYADFDIEPVGLITGILTIALYLLPFAISALIGGGIGLLVGGFIGAIILSIVTSIVAFCKNKIEAAQRRKEIRTASNRIHKANKSIHSDILELERLKKQIPANKRSVVANHNLCSLLSSVSENTVSFDMCVKRCAADYDVLLRIRSLERKIRELANEYEFVGDEKRAAEYRCLADK